MTNNSAMKNTEKISPQMFCNTIGFNLSLGFVIKVLQLFY